MPEGVTETARVKWSTGYHNKIRRVKQMKNLKMFVCGFMVCVLLMGITAVAFADSGVDVTAVLSGTIKMKLNGQDFNPQDTDGTYVKPLVYNGRTYLPVKFLAQALNIPVDWDGSTSTVWIGGQTEKVAVTSSMYNGDILDDILPFTQDADKLATPDAAYKWGLANTAPIQVDEYAGSIQTGGKYKYFNASVFMNSSGGKSSQVVNFRSESKDGAIIKTLTLQPGATSPVNLDIGGAQQLFITFDVHGDGQIDKLIIGEPTLSN
jgi:hypothetical protein